MFRGVFVFALFALSLCSIAGEPVQNNKSAWPASLPDFVEKVVDDAKQSGKPILLGFGAEWCGPCKLMDRKVFPDPRVTSELDHWLTVKVDRDKFPDLAASFSVSGLPTYLVIKPDGTIVDKTLGYHIPQDFVAWLSQARADQP